MSVMVENTECEDVAEFNGGDGGDVDDCNLSLIHWAVKHNNRRLLER